MPADTLLPVTVIVPTYNEQGWIRDCLDSLRGQDHPDMTILVVDGRSEDDTRSVVEHVAAVDPRVRLLDNPRRTAAAAMNVGLAATRTDVIVRADAHAVYDADFVRQSLTVLVETDAVDVGGPMRAVGTTRFGRAVAAVTSSRIGMGSGAFHWATDRREVDTVYLGCYWVEQLRAIGGYDEDTLQWAAEDQELNFRLRLAGGRLVLDPSIRSWYFPRDTPRALWRQYRNYGVCKVSTLAKHRRLPTLRPLAPPALVVGLGAGIPLALTTRRWIYFSPAVAWLVAIIVAAFRMGREPGVDRSRATAALAICHLGYGVGFAAGIGRLLTRRGFETRPAGRR